MQLNVPVNRWFNDWHSILTVGICKKVWSTCDWIHSRQGNMVTAINAALKLKRAKDASTWHSDALQWVENGKLLNAIVTTATVQARTQWITKTHL